jgi:hypothetical protein
MVWLVGVWQGLLTLAALGGRNKGPFCPQALSSTVAARHKHQMLFNFFVFDMVKL